MKKVLSVALCLLLLLGLTACGAGSGENFKTQAAPMAMNSVAGSGSIEAVEEFAMDSSAALTEGSADAGTALPESRKWIITVHMNAETEDLDAALPAIEEHITNMGGYVEDQYIYNGSAHSGRGYRNTELTIRIPAEKVEAFTTQVASIANVVNKSKSIEDITLTYTATESRMKALQTEETRLLELLAEAETMSDLLEIEARLTDVRYELESITSQLRLMDNQVNYATIHLYLGEVKEYTPVEEPTLWERISGGFKDSLEGVGEGFVDAFVWLIVSSPYILVFGVLAVVLVVVIKRIRKKHGKNKKSQA